METDVMWVAGHVVLPVEDEGGRTVKEREYRTWRLGEYGGDQAERGGGATSRCETYVAYRHEARDGWDNSQRQSETKLDYVLPLP